jgi:hypothetical protein
MFFDHVQLLRTLAGDDPGLVNRFRYLFTVVNFEFSQAIDAGDLRVSVHKLVLTTWLQQKSFKCDKRNRKTNMVFRFHRFIVLRWWCGQLLTHKLFNKHRNLEEQYIHREKSRYCNVKRSNVRKLIYLLSKSLEHI